MPAQKRASYQQEEEKEDHPQLQLLQDDVIHGAKNVDEESDRSPLSSNGDEKGEGREGNEYVVINLSEIRKEVQCPICLGIIRKTRTVMECLHRFCRECIDKSMRLGNNECPACRTHCASRRSLRDDPNFDALIAVLYPDIDKYEEEELAFNEEEMARNKQIQASIGNTICQQATAFNKKRQRKAAASAKKTQTHDAQFRAKKNAQSIEYQGSSGDEDDNGDGVKDLSSADDHSVEGRPKRSKRWNGIRSTIAYEVADENDTGENREPAGSSAGLVGPSDMLSWGKNGVRSHTRHGSANASNGKSARNSRLSKLVDYLKNLEECDNEFELQITLVSFDEKRTPSLQLPYLCCRPTLSVKHLCRYVALQTALQEDEIEMYLVEELNSKLGSSISATTPVSKPGSIDPRRDKLQALEEKDTLARLRTNNFSHGHLLLAYQKKQMNL